MSSPHPWGNGNSVYDEIADFGRKIVPIMPSFLDAEPGNYLSISSPLPSSLLLGQLKNEYGILLVIVNQTTKKEFSGNLSGRVCVGSRCIPSGWNCI